MAALILQTQLLLAALSAFLPLIAPESRARAAALLDIAAKALAAAASVAEDATDLAHRLAAMRLEIEAMAAAGRPVSPAEVDALRARLDAARTAFLDALAAAERTR
ncbi:MAG: hypothetical protein GC206_10485 [Alphaproteobacteria bacterium]|nr:hypothetical protein [Alphaproteobacteria bacterium]